jgi:type II secretory pathway component GspD/PulD (secretin)
MNANPGKTGLQQWCVCALVGLTLGLMLTARGASAQQAQGGEQKPATAHVETPPRVEMYESLQLTNMTEQHRFNDVQTALRNFVPRARVYGVPAQSVISVWGTQEEIDLARKIVADLDRPSPEYKLTFTITETEAGKQTSVQHLSMVGVSGAKTVMKQGSRIPIVTGSYKEGAAGENTQVQYQDVGLSIEASLDGKSVHTKVEQTSPASEPSGMGASDPVVRQSVLEGTSTLSVDKQVVLGTLDIPGSTRHQEVAMIAELVR